MRKSFKAAIVGAVALAALPIVAVAGNYTQFLMNDGTYTWTMQSVSGQLAFSQNTNGVNGGSYTAGATVLTLDPVNGPILPATTTVAALPTCNAAIKGALRTVSDATTPTYNGTLTGSGAVVVPVFCNGSAWLSH